MYPAFDSPIEVILYRYLINNPIIMQWGIRVYTQVPVYRYRVDILLTDFYNRPLCVVECDGKAYHASSLQKSNDAVRNRNIKRMTGLDTLRFTGSQINNNATKCVTDILYYLQSGRKPRRQW